MNIIDEGVIVRELLLAKLISTSSLPFNLSRYMGLKISDFSDNLTTVNPQELFMGGVGGGGAGELEGGMNMEDHPEMQQFQQMLDQQIAGRQQPMFP